MGWGGECVTGKRCYSSKASAKTEEKLARKRGRNLRLQPYLCTVCGHWHLTTRRSARKANG